MLNIKILLQFYNCGLFWAVQERPSEKNKTVFSSFKNTNSHGMTVKFLKMGDDLVAATWNQRGMAAGMIQARVYWIFAVESIPYPVPMIVSDLEKGQGGNTKGPPNTRQVGDNDFSKLSPHVVRLPLGSFFLSFHSILTAPHPVPVVTNKLSMWFIIRPMAWVMLASG